MKETVLYLNIIFKYFRHMFQVIDMYVYDYVFLIIYFTNASVRKFFISDISDLCEYWDDPF